MTKKVGQIFLRPIPKPQIYFDERIYKRPPPRKLNGKHFFVFETNRNIIEILNFRVVLWPIIYGALDHRILTLSYGNQ